MTGFAPVIWSVWGVVVLLFIAVKLYAARLARDEESQIFLGDSSEHEKSVQTEIVSRVHKIEPARKATWVLLGVATVFVISYYLHDIYRQFNP